jgi:putative acetyltransferase
MHTTEAQRGRGVGAALLEHIIRVARSRRYVTLWVETGTREVFAPALALYRKFGFTDCGPFGDYVADPRSAFLVARFN